MQAWTVQKMDLSDYDYEPCPYQKAKEILRGRCAWEPISDHHLNVWVGVTIGYRQANHTRGLQ